MALFKIFKGKSADLGKTGATTRTNEGYAYFTPDDGKFYIDITSGYTPLIGRDASNGANRICINSIDNLILDCGTAAKWDIPEVNPPEPIPTIIHYNFGSSTLDNNFSILINSGKAQLNPTDIIINGGTSLIEENE